MLKPLEFSSFTELKRIQASLHLLMGSYSQREHYANELYHITADLQQALIQTEISCSFSPCSSHLKVHFPLKWKFFHFFSFFLIFFLSFFFFYHEPLLTFFIQFVLICIRIFLQQAYPMQTKSTAAHCSVRSGVKSDLSVLTRPDVAEGLFFFFKHIKDQVLSVLIMLEAILSMQLDQEGMQKMFDCY